MALTKKLNRIGMAAQIEKREFRQYLEDTGNSNSLYFRQLLEQLLLTIITKSKWVAIWDSETVPQNATYELHCKYAEAIISGQLKIVTRPGD